MVDRILKLAEMAAQILMLVVMVSQMLTWVELSRQTRRAGQTQNLAELVD